MFSGVAFSKRATISTLVGSANLAAILNFTAHGIWAEILVVKEPIRDLRCRYLVTCVYNNLLYSFYSAVFSYSRLPKWEVLAEFLHSTYVYFLLFSDGVYFLTTQTQYNRSYVPISNSKLLDFVSTNSISISIQFLFWLRKYLHD